jgi:hypothetical protein
LKGAAICGYLRGHGYRLLNAGLFLGEDCVRETTAINDLLLEGLSFLSRFVHVNAEALILRSSDKKLILLLRAAIFVRTSGYVLFQVLEAEDADLFGLDANEDNKNLRA